MAIERVVLNAQGGQSSKPAAGGAMSADGRYVVFTSSAAHILGGEDRGSEVYLRDTLANRNYLISRAVNGDSDGGMGGVAISADGATWSIIPRPKTSSRMTTMDFGTSSFSTARPARLGCLVTALARRKVRRRPGADGSKVAFVEDRGDDDRLIVEDFLTGQ